MAHVIDLNQREEKHRTANREVFGPGKIMWSGPSKPEIINNKSVLMFSAVLVLTGILFYIAQGSLLIIVVFALAAFVVIAESRRKPSTTRFEISPVGIRIGNNLHEYNDFKSFWVDFRPDLGIKEISFQPKNFHFFYLRIPLGTVSPINTRVYLMQFLPEVEHKTTLADVLARRLGI